MKKRNILVFGAAIVAFATVSAAAFAQRQKPLCEPAASSMAIPSPTVDTARLARTAGTLKIFCEEGKVDSTGRHAQLSDSLAAIFRRASNHPELARLTIRAISALYNGVGAENHGFFSTAVRTGTYDCENLSVLLFEAYLKAGFAPSFVIFEGHVGLAVGAVIIEPSERTWYFASNCTRKIEMETSNPMEIVPVFALINRASEAEDCGDYKKAISLLQLAKKIAPRLPEIYKALSRVYWKSGDRKGATEELRGYSLLLNGQASAQ